MSSVVLRLLANGKRRIVMVRSPQAGLIKAIADHLCHRVCIGCSVRSAVTPVWLRRKRNPFHVESSKEPLGSHRLCRSLVVCRLVGRDGPLGMGFARADALAAVISRPAHGCGLFRNLDWRGARRGDGPRMALWGAVVHGSQR